MSAFGSAKCCSMSDTPSIAGPNKTQQQTSSRAPFMEPILGKVREISSAVFAGIQIGAAGASATKPSGKVTLKTTAPFKCCWQARPTSDKELLIWSPTQPLGDIDNWNQTQFPSLQPGTNFSQTLIDYLSPKQMGILNEMGFRLDEKEPQALITPSIEKLKEILVRLKSDNPELKDLELVQPGGLLEADEFIEKSLGKFLICSSTSAQPHDLFFHVMPTLLNIFQDPKNYLRYKKDVETLVRGYLDQLQEAELNEKDFLEELNQVLESKIQGGRAISKTEWDRVKGIIRYCIGAYLDVETSKYYSPVDLEKYPPTEEIKKNFLEHLSWIILDEKWQKAWARDLGIEKSSDKELVTEDPNTGHLLHAIFIKAGLQD